MTPSIYTNGEIYVTAAGRFLRFCMFVASFPGKHFFLFFVFPCLNRNVFIYLSLAFSICLSACLCFISPCLLSLLLLPFPTCSFSFFSLSFLLFLDLYLRSQSIFYRLYSYCFFEKDQVFSPLFCYLDIKRGSFTCVCECCKNPSSVLRKSSDARTRGQE